VSRRAPGRRPPLRPDLPRSARGQGTEVRAQHDVRVQHLEQRLEVAVPCGRQKGVDDFALSVEGGVGNRVLALDSATRAAGELTCRLGRAVDDRRDLVEGQGEMSCSTNASRLDGLRSSTTSSARPTESASSASCSGSIPSARSTIGSGMWTPSGSSLRTLREREHVQRDARDDRPDRQRLETAVRAANRSGAPHQEGSAAGSSPRVLRATTTAISR
jgi:hypothetical protein